MCATASRSWFSRRPQESNPILRRTYRNIPSRTQQLGSVDRSTLADLTVAILFSGCIGNLSLAGVRVQRPGNGSMGSRKYQLTFNGNPLPYGCGSPGYNICGFV